MDRAPILVMRDRCRTYVRIEESPEIIQRLDVEAR